MEQFMNESRLQILTERTWDLHSRINDRVHQNAYSFCSHCSNQGRHCVVAENTLEERETMIGIKNCLQDVHSNLVLLQGVKSSQTKQKHEALSRLVESRMLLVERIDQCSEKVRKLDVIKELMTFLGDGKTGFVLISSKVKEKRSNGICSFLVSTTRFALEYAVMFVSIYSAVTLYNHRQKNEKLLKGKIAAAVDTTVTRKMVTDSNIHLDVLCGRG